MNDIVVDKNDSVFKSNISISNLCVGFIAIGNILFYVIAGNIIISLFLTVFSVFVIVYGLMIYKAASYYLYVFIVGVYYITLSVIYQLYYIANYGGRYDLFFLFYFVILILVFMEYSSLRRNGVFLRIFDGIDKSIYHVIDVFGEKKVI